MPALTSQRRVAGPTTWIPSTREWQWHLAEEGSLITHLSGGRLIALGTATLPVGPLHHDHIVRFLAVTRDAVQRVTPLAAGCVGVTDAAVHHCATTGGRAWGVELLDGGWRCASNACKSAEQRGDLISPPEPGDTLTLHIACTTRIISVALNDEAPVPLPVPLADDIRLLRPWAVSAFAGDAFQLVSVEVSERLPWSPEQHIHFPAPARARAWAVMRLGHQIAARLLPEHAQGGFLQVWLSAVLPQVVDHAIDTLYEYEYSGCR